VDILKCVERCGEFEMYELLMCACDCVAVFRHVWFWRMEGRSSHASLRLCQCIYVTDF